MDLSFIHRYHLLLKTHYFLFFSAFGVIFPILNLTLRSHGLSNTEISFSNIILPFLVFLTSPFIGFIADKSRRFLLTFNIILFIVIITFTALFFLPYIKSYHIQADFHHLKQSEYVLHFCASQEVATKCSLRSECGCTYQSYCQKENLKFNFTFTMNSYNIQKELNDNQQSQCGIVYQIPIVKNFSEDYQKSLEFQCEITCSIPYFCHGLRYRKQMIYILLYSILYIIGANLLSVGNAVGASIGFASLSHANLFGRQRVWGTIGFGILAFVTSRIYEFYRSEYVYIIIFNSICILTILVTSFIPISKIDKTDKKEKQKFHFSTLILLFKNIDVLVFLSITFVWGMCFGGMQPYLFLYIDEIAPCQSRSVIGWMSLIAAFSEVFAFCFATRMIQFFGTNFSSIIIFLAFAVRFSGYYFIQKPYFLLPMETMHFFNFGILYVLISQKADSLAPPGLSGTLQGVAHGITHGLGRGIGLLVASYIYIVIEQRLLFLVFAILNLIAAIIYSIYFFLTRGKPSSKNVIISNNNDVIIPTDIPLNEELLPSLTMMATNNNDNK